MSITILLVNIFLEIWVIAQSTNVNKQFVTGFRNCWVGHDLVCCGSVRGLHIEESVQQIPEGAAVDLWVWGGWFALKNVPYCRS